MRKVVFITGTRADYGKLKSLIDIVYSRNDMEAHLFVTGMHMLSKYGSTVKEVERGQYTSIHKHINQNAEDSMDVVLGKTISGLSDYIKELQPDLIIVHGDRVEALAGAMVGSLNNILVGHIEGGELSGTIDELIRHSISKMSHLHFVCNESAKKRLSQMGEREESIFIIGSPDMDIMKSERLPAISDVKLHYDIPFESYGVVMYHPVTTELDSLKKNIDELCRGLERSSKNYVIVYPNNDSGTKVIIERILEFNNDSAFRIFPSIRFESFLTLLKNASCIIGNSSAGVREAPFYGVPTINIGTRQNGRSNSRSIVNVDDNMADIVDSIDLFWGKKFEPTEEFGAGGSDEIFGDLLSGSVLWSTPRQKVFVDLN